MPTITERNKLLPFVNKPGRYLGHEHNIASKNWDNCQVRCALVFPDLYEIGMSHQGLQILYHILNNEKSVLAERCYCPDRDMEHLLMERQAPLCSLESDRPLTDFDLIGISLPYELCYTNILTILSLARIPLRSKDRGASFPLILGGGSCAMNPEPVADFFDAILLGDGEEAIIDITDLVTQAKASHCTREELLAQLASIKGVYVPAFFQPSYTATGAIQEIRNLAGPTTSKRRILADLNQTTHLHHPIVPNAKIVHDRLGIEIARGCTRGCRFCQAGIVYRPVRERTPEQILDLARTGLGNSGFDELALLSLSTGDYSCIESLLPQLMDHFADDFVSVSMPSMRVGTLTETVMDQIKRVRKTGFTLAPEAGSERMRRVINKGITEEDLLTTCQDAFRLGWKVMKFYFMIGLPSETMEDIDAIMELAKKARQEGDRCGRGRKQITVSLGTFVPKPHTPFQWEPQLGIDESRERIRRIKQAMPKTGISLKWHDPEQSFLEGVFSRGDRRLSALLETAWNNGARLDAWSDHFNLEIWRNAATQCGLILESFLRQRTEDEILPWQHLESGVDSAFLKVERDKALTEAYTPDCRYHGCQQCGLCDFKAIRPIVQSKSARTNATEPPVQSSANPTSDRAGATSPVGHFKYRVTYSRRGDICFLGHLELLQLIFRALRRAGITTNFSQGFNPSPSISFGPALPVGTESLAEYFLMDLPVPLENPDTSSILLNRQLPDGISIEGIELHSGKVPAQIISHYTLTLPRPLTSGERDRLDHFLRQTHFTINRLRKGKEAPLDIRPFVTAASVTSPETLEIALTYTSGQPGLKPIEILTHVLLLDSVTAATSNILKTSWLEAATAPE